jgi:hypothetical protein
MHMENFGGAEGSKDERRKIDPGYEMPGLQEVPAELPEKDKRKFPEGIEHWPDISDLGEDDPLPGDAPEEKKPPTLH